VQEVHHHLDAIARSEKMQDRYIGQPQSPEVLKPIRVRGASYKPGFSLIF